MNGFTYYTPTKVVFGLNAESRVGALVKAQGCKGLVLTCKDKLVPYYVKFGFVSEGISQSTHGDVIWYQMRLTL